MDSAPIVELTKKKQPKITFVSAFNQNFSITQELFQNSSNFKKNYLAFALNTKVL